MTVSYEDIHDIDVILTVIPTAAVVDNNIGDSSDDDDDESSKVK